MWTKLAFGLLLTLSDASAAVTSQKYTWNNVRIGGGGGFVPDIVFNQKQKGVAFARTDIGGSYRLNSDDSWTPLLDFVNDTTWDEWGSDALASDPTNANIVYIAAGLYTNSWDPNNGKILKSTDMGNTWTASQLPFKVGGNMPGRGMGERLAIDPNNNKILYFGARSGHGLWRSTDAGVTWSNVTSFPSVGTYVQDPTDSTGLGSDIMGIAWVTFDSTAKTSTGTSRIFVGVANAGSDNLFVSTDSGSTWSAVAGQNNTFMSHKGVLSPSEKALYLSYNNGIGPYDGTDGAVMKYYIANSTWVNISPAAPGGGFGYGGLAVDLQKPGTVMVAAMNEWYPDANIWRSLDGGATWTDLWEATYPPPNYSLSVDRHYNWDVSRAPWIATFTGTDTKLVGWMIEGLAIDPFDSNHMLWGTGLTLMGTRDLTTWDSSPRQNITISSLATGIEETAVLGLTSPPKGPLLVSTVGDVGGFVHTSLTTPPNAFTNPVWAGTGNDVDHAGANASNIARVGGTAGSAIATSQDGGVTWAPYPGASSLPNASGGKIAMSANGDSLVWSQAGFSGAQVSKNGAPFVASQGLSGSPIITADKQNDTVFYSSSGSGPTILISTNAGVSFVALTSHLGNAQTINAIAANPFTAGDFFVSTDVGIFHSTNYGKSFVGLNGPTEAWDIAVGAPSATGKTPALFAAAIINGVSTLFRTDDLGSNWARLTDAAHGLSQTSGMVLAADPRTYTQIYVGTNGRGIFYGHA